MAESDIALEDLFFSTIASDTPVRHDGFIKTTVNEFDPSILFFQTEVSPTEVSPSQIGLTESNVSECSILKNCSSQITTGKSKTFNAGFTEINSTHVGTMETGFTEISVGQIGSTEISSFNIGLPEMNPTHSSITEISPNSIAFSKINSPQISVAEDNSIQVRYDIGEVSSPQDNTTQIQPFELSWLPHHSFGQRLVDNNSTEVSFPGPITIDDISKQNFFHDNQIYSSKIDVINNTATNIWSNLLNPSTQLNIDFQITDLPTGQLAEATITDYDNSGNSLSGTIQIDHDANGVGWFIDPTPQDNSEFKPQHLNS